MQISQAVSIHTIVFGPAVQCIKLPRSITTETIYSTPLLDIVFPHGLLILLLILPLLLPYPSFSSSYSLLHFCYTRFEETGMKRSFTKMHCSGKECISSNKDCESVVKILSAQSIVISFHALAGYCICNKRHSAIWHIWYEQA